MCAVHKASVEILVSYEHDAFNLQKGTPGSAGFDLAVPQDVVVKPRGVAAIHTGVRVVIPEGYVGLVVERSSLHKRGLRLANTVGVIDSDYRGELIVKLRNTLWLRRVRLVRGERVAQLVVMPAPTVYLEVVSDAEYASYATDRGTGGFGSTGVA